MASTPLLPEPQAYAGAWTLRAAGPRAGSCRLVLRVERAALPPRTGHALEASPDCMAKLSLDLAFWRPETSGLVLEGREASDVLLFEEDRAGLVARSRDGRVRYTLSRASKAP